MNFIIIFIMAVLTVELPVYGYIDPGTGSYVFQILIASLLAVSFVVRSFWDKIKLALASMWKKVKGTPKT